MGLVVVAHGLSCPVTCGIFLDQDRTHVPCISRPILNRWAPRKAPLGVLFQSSDLASCVCLVAHRVRLFETPRTAARQAPLSMGILQTRILEWVAYPDPGIKLGSPTLQVDSLPAELSFYGVCKWCKCISY